MEEKEGISLCILINVEYAFLMYLRNKGDSGFHSSSYLSEDKESLFTLSNGQDNALPLSWLVNRNLAKKAMIYFFEEEAMYNGIKYLVKSNHVF